MPPDDDGVPGPRPVPPPMPAAFWRRTISTPTWSVSIRNSVWSPRYVPWLIRPGTDVQPAAPSAAAGADRLHGEPLGRTATVTLSSVVRVRGGIRDRAAEAQAAVGLDGRPAGRAVELRDPAHDGIGHADEVGDEAVDRRSYSSSGRRAAGSGRRA